MKEYTFKKLAQSNPISIGQARYMHILANKTESVIPDTALLIAYLPYGAMCQFIDEMQRSRSITINFTEQ